MGATAVYLIPRPAVLPRPSARADFVDYMLSIKQAEIDRFLSSVTGWEQREYFDFLSGQGRALPTGRTLAGRQGTTALISSFRAGSGRAPQAARPGPGWW